jgi:hypothetical protein
MFGRHRDPEGPPDTEAQDTLRFGVEKARFTWGAFVQDSWLGKASIQVQYQNPVRGPAVVAHNVKGEKRSLEVAKAAKEARVRAAAIEQEFTTMDTAQWCERYDVPRSFVAT